MLALRSAPCVAAALALLASGARASDGSIRCDGGIVSVGDSKLDLVGKCGWPALQEDLVGERTTTVFERRGQVAFNRSVTAKTERWTYDFGPNRFIQMVLLEGGRILRIERGSYGYGNAPSSPRPSIPRARCADAVFHEGEGPYEVLSRCGDPVFREVRVEQRTRVVGDDPLHAARADTASVLVEVWTYDFGPAAFVRHLTFEDGRLVRVDTGSYGYAR
jgi:Protein of unknown function (DUF2845)